MGNVWIISTANDSHPKVGSFKWWGTYFNAIKPYLEKYDSTKESYAYLYFNRANNRYRKALKLKITHAEIEKNYLNLRYITDSESCYTSYQICLTLKEILQKRSVNDIPYCIVLDENHFKQVIESNSLLNNFQMLCKKRMWQKIYNEASKYKPWEKSELWNSPSILQIIAFATAKLSECTINLRKEYRDKVERKKFLQQKSIYRNETLKLRKRLIELEPWNAAHYSTLGYSYYQNVIELSTVGGRRDGDIFKEAEYAIYYFDKAIEKDTNRLPEIYRKGQIFIRLIPKAILYATNDDETFHQRVQRARQYIQMGIDALIKGIQKFENNIHDKNRYARWQKYYIKSLYNGAYGYLQLGKPMIKIMANSINCVDIHTSQKYEYLLHGIQWIDTCIHADSEKPSTLDDDLEKNGVICSVYKSYLKGVLNLYCYVINRNEDHRKNALHYLQKANELRFPTSLQNQRKFFVLEKMAFLYLYDHNYETAKKFLEPFYKNQKSMPEYAMYTLALIYALERNKEESIKICENILEKSKSLMAPKFQRLYEYCSDKSSNIELQEEVEDTYGDT